jgi:hypothetical protein
MDVAKKAAVIKEIAAYFSSVTLDGWNITNTKTCSQTCSA